jgi:hypothetical protein
MNAEQQPEPRQSRATVLPMPRRGPEPPPNARQTAPPRAETAEPAEEPGYGHGV